LFSELEFASGSERLFVEFVASTLSAPGIPPELEPDNSEKDGGISNV
jgi:hypothetical protein